MSTLWGNRRTKGEMQRKELQANFSPKRPLCPAKYIFSANSLKKGTKRSSGEDFLKLNAQSKG